ncbi:GNAT family N-acetyltransferase [Aquimarina sp. 2201CG1-2-11]|uniref:GNAT family N-acetyltransferase n=1 Tax=Aquimarina discodermiae TaxID=3231043 RepID=UPI0034619270
MITIRLANTNDAASIAVLGKSTFDIYYRHLFENQEDIDAYLTNAFSLEKINNSLANTKNTYWIAEDVTSNLKVGYAKLQLDASTNIIGNGKGCKLQRIYILPGFESSGIGMQLQKLIERETVNTGNEYVWLSTLKSNKGAMCFYDREGYTIIGEDQYTIGEQTFDHWIFAKKLINTPCKN